MFTIYVKVHEDRSLDYQMVRLAIGYITPEYTGIPYRRQPIRSSLQSYRGTRPLTYAQALLHLREIVEGLYFHSSLSVCLSVCLCVRHFL